MVHYIESGQTDPRWNLALEQFVFDALPRENSYFMLWQNHNSIIIGKHQNTSEEINAAFVKEREISVVRRLSGGGAVYHDLGNINFTFISDVAGGHAALDFEFFCRPVSEALRSFGVPVELSGRNDMTVEGKKFSGNAQYVKQNRVMHHGTILYDSDLSVLSQALKPGDDKILSRGIKSVQSRVTNIRPYMKSDIAMSDFWAALKGQIGAALGMVDFQLTAAHRDAVGVLCEERYSRWSWNYGGSPPHSLRKARRIEGCGKIEVLLDIAGEGRINGLAFYGDFFSNRDPADLAARLTGRYLNRDDIMAALAGEDIGQYFHALDTEGFLSLLLE
ncbi:MAG: lipoate--protein ligase [Spirochaetes bacterium]|nr:lipoate--protein ligase [Spirochaetota bacterium]